LFNKFIWIGNNNQIIRENWTKNQLSKIPRGNSILDVGAGELRFKEYCSHLEYQSQDFCQYDGLGDGKGLQTSKWDTNKIDIVSDISNIPVPNSSYDAILCTEVFEHIPDPISAIAEFSRILKKEGVLIITAPFSSLTHFAPYYYYSGFSKYFYEYHLNKNGFMIEEVIKNGNFFEFLAQEIRRVKYISKKTAFFWKVISFISSFPILVLLQYLSKKVSSTDEFLYFGTFIRARRK